MIHLLFLLTVWSTEVVTTTARELIGPPLAIDSYGVPYVLVCSDQLGSCYLILFYKFNGNWIADTLESNAMPECRDIAIDKFGRIWCIYYTYNSADSCRYLIVASKDSHGWRKDTIEISNGYDFFSNSIVTDTLGRAHITYDFNQYGIYAYLNDSIWVKEMIDPNATYNYLYCAIDLDSQNRAHISYYQFGLYNGPIWYAKKIDSLWNCEVVESPANVNMWWPTSIRVGRNGVGIAYTNPDPQSYRFKFAYNEGAGWQIDTLTSGMGGIWNQKALAIDSLGRYWLLYTSGIRPIVAFKDSNGWHNYSLPPLSLPLTRSRSGSIHIDTDNKIHMTRLAANDDYSYREIHYIYGTPEGIGESERLKVEGERLKLEVLPNVVRDNAQMQYTIPEKQAISLKLYDIVGRKIATIAEGIVEPGVYSYNFDSSHLSSGIYFLILKGEKETKCEKLLIVK